MGSYSATLPAIDPNASLKITQPPHPAWKMGDGVLAVEKEWIEEGDTRKTWDMDRTQPSDVYRLLISAIVPRPLAFVSSLSPVGIPNLALFSYFSMVSHNPPLVSISFKLSPGKQKDTRENVLATKEFTVSIISQPFIEAANAISAEAPPDVDEWIVSGLTMAPGTYVKPAYVKESAISMECELYSFQDIAPLNSTEISTTIVLGLVKRVHVRTSVLAEGGDTIDHAKLRVVARLGSSTYSRLLDAFELRPVAWGDVREEYEVLKNKGNHST